MPEPLAENLTDLSESIKVNKSDFGIAVDPDVDRLVFFDENGKILGEEYTQVFCSDLFCQKIEVIQCQPYPLQTHLKI